MAEVWNQTRDISLQRDYAGYYGPEARLNLMTAIENGAPGAQGAYDYLWPFIGINNFWGDASTTIPDLAMRAGWALGFYPAATAPPTGDTTAPMVSVPASVTAEATSPAGATVTFSATATDNVDGPTPAQCVPISGSTFALGAPTTITCTATDAAGNMGSASFTVTVVDTTPPVLTVPANITANATSAAGAAATFVASAADLVDGATPTLCTPASGSTFGIGATTVTCTSTDSRANTGSRAFTVTVVAMSGVTRIAPIADQFNAEGDHVRLEVTLLRAGNTIVPQAQLSSQRRDNDNDDEDDNRDESGLGHDGIFAAIGLPPGVRITKYHGVIKGRLDTRSAGIYHVIVTFTDRRGATFSKGFTWTVRDGNQGRK
jgi:hypothetical protein